MEDYKITEYFKKCDKVTVPMVQRALSLPYFRARAIIAEYVKKGELEPEDGVTYKVCAQKATEGAGKRDEAPENLTEYERLRRKFTELRGEKNEQPEKDTDALIKKALWICIKKPNVTTGVIMNELSLEPSEAYGLLSKMATLGYITNTFVKIPKITEQEYIEKFGKPEEEDDDDDDEEEEDAAPKRQPFNLSGYFETVKIRTALSNALGEHVRRKTDGEGETQLIVGGAAFTIKTEDDTFYIRGGDFVLSACGDMEAAEKIVGEYGNLKLESDEITATVENQSETIGVLFKMYAAIERISHLG